MPRIVDHEERRNELAAAVWDVVSVYGLEQLTVRRVADKAGWTTGVVQHYFPTKQALVVYAFDLVQTRSLERIDEVDRGASFEDVTRSLIASLLPLDDDRQTESRVWLAFLGAAASDPALNEVAQSGRGDLVVAIGGALRATPGASLRLDADMKQLALDLIAIADGINVAAVYSRPPLTGAALRQMLDRMVTARLRSLQTAAS